MKFILCAADSVNSADQHKSSGGMAAKLPSTATLDQSVLKKLKHVKDIKLQHIFH